MQKTWMSTVAGILQILSAGSKSLILFGLFAALIVVPVNPYIDPSDASGGVPVNVMAILWGLSLPLLISCILALVGGIYALHRKKWGLALAGAIAAFLPFSLLGTAAIIFTVLAKGEFEQSPN